jgi:hypothetical protein
MVYLSIRQKISYISGLLAMVFMVQFTLSVVHFQHVRHFFDPDLGTSYHIEISEDYHGENLDRRQNDIPQNFPNGTAGLTNLPSYIVHFTLCTVSLLTTKIDRQYVSVLPGTILAIPDNKGHLNGNLSIHTPLLSLYFTAPKHSPPLSL